MLRLITSYFCLFLFISGLNTLLADDAKTAVPGIMAPMREEILALQPFLSSQKKFEDPANAAKISQALENLKNFSKTLPNHDRLKTPGFEISARVLQDQLATASEIFARGSKSLARRYVNASLKACSTCHTQVATTGGPNWDFPLNRVEGSTIDQANFWYTIRHYEKAIGLYEQVVQQYPSKDIDLESVNEALERNLGIYLRVRRSPGRAIQSLEKSFQNKKLPDSVLKRIAGWVTQMKALDYAGAPSSRTAPASALSSYAENILKKAEEASFQNLDDAHMVDFLFVSGLLYEFTNFNPGKTSPEILYWLAVADHWLDDQFFFSLSNLYLEECVRKFPKSPTAKKCYSELAEKLEVSYTGSSGVNLPDEIKSYLTELKSLM